MRRPGWLGIGERRWKKSPDEEVQPPKTAWDFLQLLIVPSMLAAIALLFNASQASRERGREDRRIREDRALAEEARRDAVLDAYLDKMSNLMLNRHLWSTRPGSDVRQVARTVTLATVRRLDASRKGEVVRFLYEAGLIRIRRDSQTGIWRDPIINLAGADLHGVNLVNASLAPRRPQVGVALRGDLRGARFDQADLRNVHFSGLSASSDLQGASFNGAYISDAWLNGLDLRGASFKRASLSRTGFTQSDLRSAVFDGAFIQLETTFNATCLSHASFKGALFNIGPRLAQALVPIDFIGAEGKGVDFSNAVNLSDVRLGSGVSEARFDGADERPKAAPKLLRDQNAFCK